MKTQDGDYVAGDTVNPEKESETFNMCAPPRWATLPWNLDGQKQDKTEGFIHS